MISIIFTICEKIRTYEYLWTYLRPNHFSICKVDTALIAASWWTFSPSYRHGYSASQVIGQSLAETSSSRYKYTWIYWMASWWTFSPSYRHGYSASQVIGQSLAEISSSRYKYTWTDILDGFMMDFQSVLSTRLFSVSGHWAVTSRSRYKYTWIYWMASWWTFSPFYRHGYSASQVMGQSLAVIIMICRYDYTWYGIHQMASW